MKPPGGSIRGAAAALWLAALAGASCGTVLGAPAAAIAPTASANNARPPGATTPPTATPPTSSASSAAPGAGDPNEDIRDIRGPKYVLPRWLLPALVAGAALLALAGYGIWRWQRRRRRPRVLLPFERALQRLEELRPLMQPAHAREFSIAASDIVRTYIEQRFDVTATHRTTEEFLHDLLESSNPSLARHRGLLAEFLQQCDLVKFAGMSLSMQSIEALQQSARAFVLETAKPEETHDALPAT